MVRLAEVAAGSRALPRVLLVAVVAAVLDKAAAVPAELERPAEAEAETFRSRMAPVLVVVAVVPEPPASRSVQILTLSDCCLAMVASLEGAVHARMAVLVASPLAVAAAMALGVRQAVELWSS